MSTLSATIPTRTCFSNDADIKLANFESDVLKNEPLIHGYTHFTRLFRFPYFKEGETAEKRDGMRSFLQRRQYRIGRATIDASDWAISWRLESAWPGPQNGTSETLHSDHLHAPPLPTALPP